MKQEARSFLKAKGKEDLIKEDMKRDQDHHYEVKIWDMSPPDIQYFEDNIVDLLSNFCLSFLNISILPNSLTSSTLDYHKTIIAEDFNDDYDQEMETNPEKLMKTETAHYVLLFMFDMLQFFSQFYMVLKPSHSTETSEELWRQAYKQIPLFYNFNPEYFLPGSSKVINSIMRVTLTICPDVSHLLALWFVRH